MNTSPPASPAACDINQGVALNAATITLVGAAAVVVAARFAVRFWIVKDIGWDDWTILLAMLGTIIGGALDIVEVHYGFGMHQNCLTEHQLLEFQKYVWGEWIQTFASLIFCVRELSDSAVMEYSNEAEEENWVVFVNGVWLDVLISKQKAIWQLIVDAVPVLVASFERFSTLKPFRQTPPMVE
ncbi:hypothetical protein MMC22_011248 [Lobaria immixta]|nr:hypothetical protein [Lobaria immixta]